MIQPLNKYQIFHYLGCDITYDDENDTDHKIVEFNREIWFHTNDRTREKKKRPSDEVMADNVAQLCCIVLRTGYQHEEF